jgi:hypothetical protein
VIIKENFMGSNTLACDRIQLHYAIQFIAATGMALGEAKPDGSQMTLNWDADLNGFVGQKIPGTQIQVALMPQTLTSLILQNHVPVVTVSLIGKTMAEALNWHQVELTKLGIVAENIKLLDYPPDDFPDHALAHGARFETGRATAREVLTDYYAATRALLATIISNNTTASPIYIWPHHFDMATLMTYPGTTEIETKYLGIGLSPGDKSYDEPYWYITPYPYPDVAMLPKLVVGNWHTADWVGAVLTASQVQNDTTVQRFIAAAVATSKDLLQVQ